MTNIVTAPNSVLGLTAQNYIFKKGDKVLPVILKEMEKVLLSASDPKGVGLAAPQIGRSVSIFMAKPTEKAKISVFINPRIVESGEVQTNQAPKKVKKLEGCLSLPSIWGEVKRAPEVTLSYFDPRGVQRTRKFTGFMATIIQHEVDHLYGVLFPRRVLEQKGKLYKSSKNEKGEDEFEELTI